MRTRILASVFLVLCILSLLVPQCYLLGFTGLGLLGSQIGNAMTLTQALGMTMTQSLVQSMLATFTTGFSVMHTMVTSLISGFVMGILGLGGFILFLLAVVPAEERRSLGGNSVFSPYLLPHYPKNSLRKLSRHSRSIVNATLPLHLKQNEDGSIPLPSLDRLLSGHFHHPRIPRFLSKLVQSDPLNCMPLVMCGLSAANKPNGRTDILNDYAYLMKEFISSNREKDDDKSDEESVENNFARYNPRRRIPIRWRDQLGGDKSPKKKKEKDVDEIIDDIQREEEDQIEDLVLTDMADDPNDLPFALEDMKIRGLHKTMSKMPHQSKQKYIEKLMGGDSAEEEEDEGYPGNSMPMEMMGHYPRHEYPDSSSGEDERFYYSKEMIRGGFPPAPPTPPVPHYGRDEELYKRQLHILDKNLAAAKLHRMRMGPRGKRDVGSEREESLIRKRREVAEALDIFEKTRIGAEAGAKYRNARQCRSLFKECPVKSVAKPVASASNSEGTPFINRAVNNLRRVLLGTKSESSKKKRVKEIEEVIQQLHPQVRPGTGSEVKVVLNIGPTPPDPHRAGPQYAQPQPGHLLINGQPVTYNDGSSQNLAISTSPKPSVASPTKKTLVYLKPSSTKATLSSSLPSVDLDSLEQFLKATTQPEFEEEVTVLPAAPNLYESVEDFLPTKYPMSKDEYAVSLRETLGIFDRFKEAHVKPKTTPQSKVTTTKATKPPAAQGPTRATTSNTNKGIQGSKKSPPKITGQKGDTVADDEPQSDIGDRIKGIVNLIKKLRKRRKKGGKGKGSKGGKGDSSEENSSEEKHRKPPPTLIAAPLPHLRDQIHWKNSANMIKDGVYHLLFSNRATKPLPLHPFHPAPSGENGPWSSEYPGSRPPHVRHFSPPQKLHRRRPPHPHGPRPLHGPPPPHRFRSDSGEETEGNSEQGPIKPKQSKKILLPGMGRRPPLPPNDFESIENSSYEADDIESTEPQLVYSPFTMISGKSSSRSAAPPRIKKKAKKKKKNKIPKYKVGKKKKVNQSTTNASTTTAKPKRKILKYKG